MKKTTISIIILLISTLSFAQLQQKPLLGVQINWADPLSKGLVGCWLMNERSGGKVFDLSGNGNIGTLVADTHFVPGKFGNCLSFDGTGDYVDIADADILTPPKALSAFCLIKPVDITFRGLFGKYDSNIDQRSWSMYTTATDKLQITLSSTLDPWTGIQRYTDTALVDGLWQWVGFVFDGGAQTLKLYVNGVEQATTDASGSVPTGLANNTLPLYIGHPNRVVDANDYLGLFDHAMIFNRALTAAEATRLYRQPFWMFRPSWNWSLYGAIVIPSVTGQIIIINMN